MHVSVLKFRAQVTTYWAKWGIYMIFLNFGRTRYQHEHYKRGSDSEWKCLPAYLLAKPNCQKVPILRHWSKHRQSFLMYMFETTWGEWKQEYVLVCAPVPAPTRACANYSIPGVKHITEQITEISFNFDVQFVQPAPCLAFEMWNISTKRNWKLQYFLSTIESRVLSR